MQNVEECNVFQYSRVKNGSVYYWNKLFTQKMSIQFTSI